ncbi:MAG TPA: hypothetical protein VMV92_32780 [Streptosporangiaceae bacterium]|nr:hypothetical protein [Streptosporangiaceae bacterium]
MTTFPRTPAAAGASTLSAGSRVGYGAADVAGVSRGCRVIAGILAGLPAGPLTSADC